MERNKGAAIVVVICLALTIASQSAAQHNQDRHKRHHYRLVDLGALGGPASYDWLGSAILNPHGTSVGWADTSSADPFPAFCFTGDCYVAHAFQWRNDALTDLGALTDEISSAALWVSPNGLIAGVSETGATDPLYAGLPEVHAVVWEHGGITDLGTLPQGGYESYAAALNSRGQVVGAVLNTVSDTNSMQPAVFWLWGGISPAYQYQTRAFLWDKQNGMQDLGTLPGGTDAEALVVNERGQIAGASYTSSTASSYCAQNLGFALTTGAFLWEKGTIQDLGNFGGSCTVPVYLNNQGQVVGTSTLRGDKKEHPFLWDHGKLKDLGTLGGDNAYPGFISDSGDIVGKADLAGHAPQNHHAILWKNCPRNCTKIDLRVLAGDSCSRAYWVNSRGQVVGNSENEKLCNLSGEHAFLWENGEMLDLDTLIPPGASLKLSHALVINDRGEIAGIGVPPGCKRSNDDFCGHAYVLIPCDENEPGSCREQVARPAARPSPLERPRE